MSEIPDDIMAKARELRQRIVWSSNEAVQEIAAELMRAEQRGSMMERARIEAGSYTNPLRLSGPERTAIRSPRT